MHDNDLQLLLATRRGDQLAARALWSRHAPRLLAYARSIVRPRGTMHDADDVLQSAFCRIMTLPEPDLLAVREPGPWLAHLTRNTALNWLRTHRREAARRGHATTPTPTAHVAGRDPTLADAVDALPARFREVVILKHIAGLTFDQIETATGINRNTAAARYRSAIALLRKSLDSSPSNHSTAATAHPRQKLVHHG